MRLRGRGAHQVIRWVSGLLGLLTAAGIVLVAAAPAASAHATLLFTSPAADSAVPVSPKAITLTFNEAVTMAGTPVTLTGAGGRKIALGPARESGGRSVVTVPVRGRLPHGVYTVSWQVVSADGDVVGSEFRFGVGPAPASLGGAPSAAQSSVSGQWPTAILRWMLFAGLAAALGGLAGLAALILGGGSLPAGATHPSVPRLLASGPGVITGVEFASFAVAAAALRLRRPVWAVVPLLAVAGAEGMRAHPESVVPVGGALLTWAHLLAAVLWTGMLFYTVRAAIAAWLFAVVVVTGVVSALVLVPLGDLFTTGYGRVLILKAALVAVAAALALAGRIWLRHRPQPGAGPALATRAESGTLAAVLAVSALLSTFAAPSLAAIGGALPFPPPASGPVVPLGGRAGEIGIYAAASAGQVVVHLAAPEDNGAPEAQFTVSMTLAGPRRTAGTLPVRGCGPGCVVAPARWARGDNLLTIRAAASGWTGGTTSLDVPWPPAAGAKLLRRALAAMRRVPAMTVYEQVTSDTTLGRGTTHAVGISGRQFFAGEPYAAGLAPVADLVKRSAGKQVLLLGFPGAGVWAQLTFGAHDAPYQFAREILVGPDHLITRGFAYPEK